MAPRRNSRPRDAPAQAEKDSKQKPPSSQKIAKNAGISKGTKKSTTKIGMRVTATATKTGSPDIQGLDKLSYLSPEVLDMIADNITDPPTISALSRTSKMFYTFMAPRLYRRVAVAAMFHAHIAKLIRTLEPHLTIEQKYQLKREGKYKGQQEEYPIGLDETNVPTCAGYVQQLIIGVSDPGKKHKYIVERYYEEALKNMVNLEIVETSVVNRFICEGIASLASLKALAICARIVGSSDVAPLLHIKNLKHLKLQIGSDAVAVGQSIIRNSMSTLQSLHIDTSWGFRHCFHDWQKNLNTNGHETTSRIGKGPNFAVLRSLHLEGLKIDTEFITEFPRAIDFSKLRELTFALVEDLRTLLWPLLTNLTTSSQLSNTPLDLRTLSIDMQASPFGHDPQHRRAQDAAKSSFIASFNTLTTLELPRYGQWNINERSENLGLSDTLLQAVLQHQNLRVLKISYQGITTGLEIPYLGARTIGDIIDGLPHLREFEFAPDEAQMDEISQALCRGHNLKSVTCFPYTNWNAYPSAGPLGLNILSSILSTFMSDARVDTDSGNFVWENHYKLNRLDLRHTQWDIASRFGKRKKGYKKPEKLQVEVENGTREVWLQLVPQTQYVHVGYDPLFEWATKVGKEIR